MSRRPVGRNASFRYEFFKVYLPDQSSQRMRVPPAFVKLLHGATPNKVILKDVSGKFWHVEMEEAENGVFFKDGWQRFASDQSLELGNFLVFTYHEDSSFDVKIFTNNGCMKVEAAGVQCINKGPSIVENSNIHVKVEKASEEGQTGPMPSHSCKRKYAEVEMKRSNVTCSSEESWRRSARIPSKTVEQHRTSGTPKFSLLKSPHFIASVCRSKKFHVNFPRRFLAENGIKLEPEMSLCDDEGKLWPVNINYSNDGRISFGKGWGAFLNHHKLAFRDQCAFEFVLHRGKRLCREIPVHILRARGA